MSEENKTEFNNFANCMARLRALSGENRDSRAVAYFGIPYSTYSNWLRRNRVNYHTLVHALLSRDVSLDLFFAPHQQLSYPTGLAEAQVLGLTEYSGEISKVQLTLQAMTRIAPLLEKLGADWTESEKELLVETYLGQRNELVTLSFALRQVSNALLLHRKESGEPDEPRS